MAAKQKERILQFSFPPLGQDFLLIEGLEGTEGLSQLFSFDLQLLHEETTEGTKPTFVDPKSILGKQVSVECVERDGTKRYFSGLVNSFSQGIRSPRYSFYEATIVPHAWVLTQKRQSRIFQQKSVPDILKKVFQGIDVKWEIQGTFHPREYCVQYRETDFDFASRLMEEEGIYYFFTHKNGSHQMVVANTPGSHPDCSKSTIEFYEKIQGEGFVSAIQSFDISNRYQSGKVTFWDHNFQLPGKKLDAQKNTNNVVGENLKYELYDFPGGYAKRFDGINKGGGEQPSELQKIFEDNLRKADIVKQELDARYKTGFGTSNCAALVAGHRFTLKNHPGNGVDGPYVLTAVQHSVEQSPSYVTENTSEEPYSNEFTCIPVAAPFTCIPVAAPFRPAHTTPKPILHGSQTAVVVGPAGEEIFTDKYGRVKVQFHWDREGKNNAESSCWMRVAQSWAGNQWGTMFIPRIGMEAVVSFLEGDPDQPIITGCVYNPSAMPPYKLPDEKTKATLKTNSTPGGGGFNELRFEDKKGKEQIFIHAERNEDIRVKADCFETIGGERHLVVEKKQYEHIKDDQHLHVKGNKKEKVDSSVSLNVGMNRDEKVGMKHATEAGMEIHLKAGMKVVIEAGVQLTLKGPGGFIDINPAGVVVQGTMVLINSGGMAGTGSGASPENPTDAKEADTAQAGIKIAAAPAPPPANNEPPGALAAAVISATSQGTPLVSV
jgi:type VI secretion system secreted protein VgrG